MDLGEKCPKGAKCMKPKFNFTDAYDLLNEKYSGNSKGKRQDLIEHNKGEIKTEKSNNTD